MDEPTKGHFPLWLNQWLKFGWLSHIHYTKVLSSTLFEISLLIPDLTKTSRAFSAILQFAIAGFCCGLYHGYLPFTSSIIYFKVSFQLFTQSHGRHKQRIHTNNISLDQVVLEHKNGSTWPAFLWQIFCQNYCGHLNHLKK